MSERITKPMHTSETLGTQDTRPMPSVRETHPQAAILESSDGADKPHKQTLPLSRISTREVRPQHVMKLEGGFITALQTFSNTIGKFRTDTRALDVPTLKRAYLDTLVKSGTNLIWHVLTETEQYARMYQELCAGMTAVRKGEEQYVREIPLPAVTQMIEQFVGPMSASPVDRYIVQEVYPQIVGAVVKRIQQSHTE